jgi:hypothetical protein
MMCLGWFHRGGIQVWRGQEFDAEVKGMKNRRELEDANQKSRGGTDLPCNADFMITRLGGTLEASMPIGWITCSKKDIS